MASPGPMVRALTLACRQAAIPDRYAATKALARRYAYLLDAARDQPAEDQTYEVIGPKFLAALSALGLTVARKETGVTTSGRTGNTVLDELRDRRARRPG